jgi:hypothetical protein
MTPRNVVALTIVSLALLAVLGLGQVAVAQAPSFTGRYNTNWGEVTLSQAGDSVTGSYSGKFTGAVTGTVSGGKLHFEWKQTNGESGRGVFGLGLDGRALTGTWGSNASETDGGDWSGTRQ